MNNIDHNKYDVTVQTIYDHGALKEKLHPSIRYKTIVSTSNSKVRLLLGYFFRRIASPQWTYKHFIDDNYDYAVAFLEGECTRLIGGCSNPRTKLIAWIHTDFMKQFSSNGVYKNTQEHFTIYLKYQKIVCCSLGVAEGFQERFHDAFSGKLVVKYNVIDSDRILRESNETYAYSLNQALLILSVLVTCEKKRVMIDS